jgi:hypothetical protein
VDGLGRGDDALVLAQVLALDHPLRPEHLHALNTHSAGITGQGPGPSFLAAARDEGVECRDCVSVRSRLCGA